MPANSLTRVNNSGNGNFTDTSYTLTITATDVAGNVSSMARIFTVTGS